MEKTYKYRAFISYSHKDKAFAKWLHKRIENYKIPSSLREKYPHLPKDLKRTVFRDEEELPTASVLSDNLLHALDNSEKLIVVCSPWAVDSLWVDSEISYFKQQHGEHAVLAVITGGEPNATYADDTQNEAFPKSLRYKVAEGKSLSNERTEPIAGDARSYWDREMALMKMIAGILKVDFADLWRREKRERTKRRIILTLVLSVFTALAFYGSTQFVVDKVNVELERINSNIAKIEYSIRHDELPLEKVIALNEDLKKLKDLKKAKEETQQTLGTLKTSLGKEAQEIYLEEGAISAIKVLTSRDAFSRKEQLKKELSLEEISLAKLYVETNQYDKAQKSYEEAIDIFFDYDNVLAYDEFLSIQNQYEKALEITKRLNKNKLTLEQKANVLNLLGIYYYSLKQLDTAEETLIAALEVTKTLAKVESAKYNKILSGIFNNLGNLYNDLNHVTKAEEAYTESLRVSRNLDKSNLNTGHLAMVLSNIASFYASRSAVYKINQKIESNKADIYYKEAFLLYKSLAKDNPDIYNPEIARIYALLGLFYKDKDKKEASYIEALEIYRALVKINPSAYYSELASTLEVFGDFYTTNNQTEKAESVLIEALEISKSLAEISPNIYNDQVANTLRKIAELYKNNNQLVKSKDAYTESLAIHMDLAKTNPTAYKKDVAQTLMNLGELYKESGQLVKCQDSYYESLAIYRDLAKNNSSIYNYDIAYVLSKIEVFYEDTRQLEKAIKVYVELLEIYKKLLAIDNRVTHDIIATHLTNLQYLYQETNQLQKAIVVAQEALDTYRMLALEDPDFYQQNIAIELGNLGLLYSTDNQPNIAETFYLEALGIYRGLAKDSPEIYTINIAKTLMILVELYASSNQPDKLKDFNTEALKLYKHLVKTDPSKYSIDYASALIMNAIMQNSKNLLNEAYIILLKFKGNPKADYFLNKISPHI